MKRLKTHKDPWGSQVDFYPFCLREQHIYKLLDKIEGLDIVAGFGLNSRWVPHRHFAGMVL
jgi:hypothetical protein